MTFARLIVSVTYPTYSARVSLSTTLKYILYAYAPAFVYTGEELSVQSFSVVPYVIV